MEKPKSEPTSKETKINASQGQIGVVGDQAKIEGGIHYTIVYGNYYPPEPPSSLKQESPVGEGVVHTSPYRGLFAFRPEHTHLFFGREAFTEKLVQATKNRSFVVVLGASGSGKSSVVFAGLVPALEQSNEKWLFTTFRPGSDPFYGLASSLVPLYETNLSKTKQLVAARDLSNGLKDGKLPLTDVFNLIYQSQPEQRLLIIADQFEELYTLCHDTKTRQQFLDILLDKVDTVQGPIPNLVVTLRADFLGRALAYRPLADALQDTDLKLGPMTREELSQAIEKPAEMSSLTFEAGLVERILDDIIEQPGNLPLLQYALTQLWEKRTPTGLLTHSAYKTIGQVEGAIARQAEEEFAKFERKGQGDVVRRIFTRLVLPGEDTQDNRRRASREELEILNIAKAPDVWNAIQDLTDARLVVTDRDLVTGLETVEVAHEALIRNWKRLKGWVDNKREFYIWRQSQLEPKLGIWRTNQDLVLQNEQLVEAKRWLEEQAQELNSNEKDFIFYSILHDENSDLEYWLPKYGEVSDILSYLTPYLQSTDVDQRAKGVAALGWVPQSDLDLKIYQLLQQCVLEDESIEVANLAAHAICRRGDIVKLTVLLESPDLSSNNKNRLIETLANTRNLPKLGVQVEQSLKSYKWRILIKSASQLISIYRNEFALVLMTTLMSGLLVGYFAGFVFNFIDLLFRDSRFYISFGAVDIIIILGIGLYFLVQKRLIDEQPFHTKHLYFGVIVVVLVNLLFSIIKVSGYIGGELISRDLFSQDPYSEISFGARIINNPDVIYSLNYILERIGDELGDIIAILIIAVIVSVSLFTSKFGTTRRSSIETSFSITARSVRSAFVAKILILILTFGIAQFIRAFLIGSYYDSGFYYLLDTNLIYVNGENSFQTILFLTGSGISALLQLGIRLFAYLLGFYFGLQFAFKDKFSLLSVSTVAESD